MNFKTILSLLSVYIVLVACGGGVFGQDKITVKAEIVAFDKYDRAIRVRSVPASQLFLVRVKKVLKGSESEEFLLVRQVSEKWDGLLRHAQNAKSGIQMTLSRNRTCDATLASSVFVFESVGSDEVVSRFEWLRNDIKIASDKSINCYVLVQYKK
jgi:hypothetical protein